MAWFFHIGGLVHLPVLFILHYPTNSRLPHRSISWAHYLLFRQGLAKYFISLRSSVRVPVGFQMVPPNRDMLSFRELLPEEDQQEWAEQIIPPTRSGPCLTNKFASCLMFLLTVTDGIEIIFFNNVLYFAVPIISGRFCFVYH